MLHLLHDLQERLLSNWIPEDHPRHPRARTFRTWHSRREVVLWSCTIVSFLILVFDFTSTLVPTTKFPSGNGVGIVYSGGERDASRISGGLHVIINILSTLLRGASNLCMQLCVAPTRKVIDVAQSDHTWLHIGVPSLRNLKWIAPRRKLLFLLLGFPSVPLHFL